MLTRSRGFTLIELLVSLVIMAILLSMAVPGVSAWIRNASVRSTAEAIQSGLQLARAEAVRRNTVIRFDLVTSLASGCTASSNALNWVVSQDNVTDSGGECGAPPSDDTAPRIIQKKLGAEGSDANTEVAADVSSFVFNGMGQRTSTPTTDAAINITHSADACNASGGRVRCLRLVVSRSGQIRLCDPARASTDPMGCP